MHLGALLLVLFLPIALVLKFGLSVLIGASLWWQGRYGVTAGGCEIQLENDGSCIRTANGEQRHYQIMRATAHAGFVRLMLLRAGERMRIQLVPRDAV